MSLIKNIMTVASGTLISRILGFVREILTAASLGTGPVADAFHVAFRFPNTFRRLFAEGAFNSAFVPLFSKEVEKSTNSAQKFAEEVFGILFTILIILTLFMELFMPFLIAYIIAPGFISNTDKFKMTVYLASVMFPYLACMSLSAMMGAMLNSLQRYFAAAIAPVFLNIILITVLICSWFLGRNVWELGQDLAWGVLISGIVQLVLVWGALKNSGIRIFFRVPCFSANVRRLLVLVYPAAIAGGITQINLLINTAIASSKTGVVSSLIYADRIYQLPLSVISISVATVLLPELSRALHKNDQLTVYNLQNRSVEFIILLTLPPVAVLLVMAEPIICLLYERGQFGAQSTIEVAGVLSIYGIGLPAFVLIKAFIPIFFAREDTKTPMIFAGVSAIVNILLAFFLFPHLKAKGIAIAEIAAGWVNVLLLFFTLMQRHHWKNDSLLAIRVAIFFASAVFMAFFLYLATYYLKVLLSAEASLVVRISIFSILFFCSLINYFCMASISKERNISYIRRNVFRLK